MSSTGKRSVTTLFVVAAVVAAAGPASDRLTETGTVAIMRGGWPDGTPNNRVGFTPPIGTDKGSLTLPPG